MCDHFWEYIRGTKKGVEAKCTKCNQVKVFTWYEWKKMLAEFKNLGTSRF